MTEQRNCLEHIFLSQRAAVGTQGMRFLMHTPPFADLKIQSLLRVLNQERRLTMPLAFAYIPPVVQPVKKYDRGWRKSRIAARLLYRKAKGPLRPRDQALAHELGNDPEVENRLIQQGLYYLGGGRKDYVDRKLVARRN